MNKSMEWETVIGLEIPNEKRDNKLFYSPNYFKENKKQVL